MELTPIQFAILDALYFVEPFEKIVEEVGAAPAVVGDELKTLIAHKWVQVMKFDEDHNDYVKSIFYDADHLNHYYYLATREGLLKHNGR